MSYISLVTHTRIAQFADRFEMRANGSVVYYHPDPETCGLPCSLTECEQLIQEYTQTINRTTRLLTYWVIVSAFILAILEASELLVIANWMKGLIFVVPLPCLFYAWNQASLKPLYLLGKRLPCSPPRSIESAYWHRVAALPASLFIIMMLCSGGLVYYAIVGGLENLNISYLILIASNVLLTGLWLYARYDKKN